MANVHKSLVELFTAIADAIRSKTGSSDKIVADDFPNVIMTISTGTDTSDATAVAGDILTGKTAYGAAGKLIGSMPNNGAVSQALNAGGSYTIPAGYHNGSGKVTGNSLASQTSGTAAAADIASGKTAWVNGTRLTGNGQIKVETTFGFLCHGLTGTMYVYTDLADLDPNNPYAENDRGCYYFTSGDSSAHTLRCTVGSYVTIYSNSGDNDIPRSTSGFEDVRSLSDDRGRALDVFMCIEADGIIDVDAR